MCTMLQRLQRGGEVGTVGCGRVLQLPARLQRRRVRRGHRQLQLLRRRLHVHRRHALHPCAAPHLAACSAPVQAPEIQDEHCEMHGTSADSVAIVWADSGDSEHGQERDDRCGPRALNSATSRSHL